MQPTPSLPSSKGRELDGYKPDAIFPELPRRGDRVSEVSVDKHVVLGWGGGLSRALLDDWQHPGAHPLDASSTPRAPVANPQNCLHIFPAVS